MKLKLDDGNVVVKDGKPVYEVDGKDVPFDAPAARDKIKEQAEELDDLPFLATGPIEVSN